MTIEGVPDIAMFRDNTASFSHEMPTDAIANANGNSNYVRVQVLTNAGGLNRDKQIEVVAALTELMPTAPGNPPPADRIWVLLTEAVERAGGGCGVTHTPTPTWWTPPAVGSPRKVLN